MNDEESEAALALRTVIAPPGALGIEFALCPSTGFAIVTRVRPRSPLARAVAPGDLLVRVDEVRTRAAPSIAEVAAVLLDRKASERALDFAADLDAAFATVLAPAEPEDDADGADGADGDGGADGAPRATGGARAETRLRASHRAARRLSLIHI